MCRELIDRRDEAREYMGVLFPMTKVLVDISVGEEGAGLRARVPEDIGPYSKDEIIDSLGQLGIDRFVFIDSKILKEKIQ